MNDPHCALKMIEYEPRNVVATLLSFKLIPYEESRQDTQSVGLDGAVKEHRGLRA